MKPHKKDAEIYAEVLRIAPGFKPIVETSKTVRTHIPSDSEWTDIILKAQNQDRDAMDTVTQYSILPCMKESLWMQSRGVEFEDAFQMNMEALMSCIEKCDVKIKTFGFRSFFGYFRFFCNKLGSEEIQAPSGCHIPLKIYRDIAKISEQGINILNPEEIAENRYSRTDIYNFMLEQKSTISDEYLYANWPELCEVYLSHFYPPEDIDDFSDSAKYSYNEVENEVFSGIEMTEIRTMIDYVLNRTAVTARKKDIIVKLFGLNGEDTKTLEEVAKLYNITKERVRQIEAKELNFFRRYAD